MTRRQLEGFIMREVKKWKKALGLSEWTLWVGFSDDPANPLARACVLQREWQYMQASVEFYPTQMENDSEEDIRNHVIHELLHIALAEMKERGIKHEERVVTSLSRAIQEVAS